MSGRIVEIDCDADCPYASATRKAKKAAEKGEMLPQSSPMFEVWEFRNDDAKSSDARVKLMEAIKGEISGEDKERVGTLLKMDILPMGEKLAVFLPQHLINQLHYAHNYLAKAMDEFKENYMEVEVGAVQKHGQPAMGKGIVELTEKHVAAWSAVEDVVKLMKSLFRVQSKGKYKTKADVLRSTWAELLKRVGKPVPPLMRSCSRLWSCFQLSARASLDTTGASLTSSTSPGASTPSARSTCSASSTPRRRSGRLSLGGARSTKRPARMQHLQLAVRSVGVLDDELGCPGF